MICLAGCLIVEENMKKRRYELKNYLSPNEMIATLGNFPLTGAPNFSYPPYKASVQGSISRSFLYPDQCIHLAHPHYPVVTRNLIDRRTTKPFANIPIFVDVNTPRPFIDPLHELTDMIEERDRRKMQPDHIYLDSMPFGPSCCSLQMTFGCKTMADAFHMRDQFTALSPIVLALTASTPIFRAYLSDTDTRWLALKYCLDDRTEIERGKKEPNHPHQGPIPTTRADSLDKYLESQYFNLNDRPMPYNLEAYNIFLTGDVPNSLAEELAALFIREPLQVFKESLPDDDRKSIDCFEDIHLFNWRTVRLKMPPLDCSSGWKVEFRPSEVQSTDFGNAAFCVFLYILSRLISERKLEMTMPITKVFKNFDKAQKRDAVLTEKFYWNVDSNIVELSIDQIVNQHLLSVCHAWLDSQLDPAAHSDNRKKINRYLTHISDIASYKTPTVARWLRNFVRNQAEYKGDSVVPPVVVYRMLKEIQRLNDK